MPTVFIKTYGCQMNERDSEQVARMLQERGYELVAHERDADVILINTCSVRDQAEQKALGKMGLLAAQKREQPGQILGFMGCMAQSRGKELLDQVPDVDLVVGTQQFHRVAEYVATLSARQEQRQQIVDVREEAGSQGTIRDHLSRDDRATAFVSIMQGCDMFCTFCIVPSTRGRERGRRVGEIVREVQTLVRQGVKEVTLLGQIVNLYGRHEFPTLNGQSPFVQLLYALEEVPGLERIRFASPHPAGLKPDLMEAFRSLRKLCEHMHLPLQSGNNRILKAMHRSYTRELYLKKVEALRAACPSLALTTDIIVGFPGETDAEFLDTVELVKQVQFDNAFVFRYSERRGTPAATLPDQLPEEVKEERNRILLGVIDELAIQKGEALLGSIQEILVEGPSKTNAARMAGRTRQNKIVILEEGAPAAGTLLPVRIQRTTGFTHYGVPAL